LTGSEIVQIISLVLTAVVSIVTLLVRARIIALEGEISELKSVLVEANQMIISQGLTITELSQSLAMSKPEKRMVDKPLDWQGFPPYREGDKPK